MIQSLSWCLDSGARVRLGEDTCITQAADGHWHLPFTTTLMNVTKKRQLGSLHALYDRVPVSAGVVQYNCSDAVRIPSTLPCWEGVNVELKAGENQGTFVHLFSETILKPLGSRLGSASLCRLPPIFTTELHRPPTPQRHGSQHVEPSCGVCPTACRLCGT